MKRFGAHFLGREHRPGGEVPAWALPSLPSSGPQPKAEQPKVQKSSRLVGVPARSLVSTHPVGVGCQTCTGSVWFICSRMSWILLRIFFWWPAKVTPIRSRSLQRGQSSVSASPPAHHSGPAQNPQPQPSKCEAHSLCSHLGHQVKGCKPRADKALLVPPHLDGI